MTNSRPFRNPDRYDPAGTSSGVFSLSRECLDGIHAALVQLMEDSQARCALVLDRTGCVMVQEGTAPPTIGATAAATMAALNTMVSRANSPEISVRFYGGAEVEQIHFVLLQERLVLCVLYARNVSSDQTREASRVFLNRVGPLLDADRGRLIDESSTLIESVNYIESKLDQLFKDHSH